MSFKMQPAQYPSGGYPEGRNYSPSSDTAQTYPAGTPVTFDTGAQNGIEEHALGATVTNILGLTTEGVTAGVSSNPDTKVGVISANRSNIFMAKLINGSGVVQTPDDDNLLAQYGLLKVGSGADAWFGVDESDTTHVVIEVIGYDTEIDGPTGVVYFKFIESAIQVN